MAADERASRSDDSKRLSSPQRLTVRIWISHFIAGFRPDPQPPWRSRGLGDSVTQAGLVAFRASSSVGVCIIGLLGTPLDDPRGGWGSWRGEWAWGWGGSIRRLGVRDVERDAPRSASQAPR